MIKYILLSVVIHIALVVTVVTKPGAVWFPALVAVAYLLAFVAGVIKSHKDYSTLSRKAFETMKDEQNLDAWRPHGCLLRERGSIPRSTSVHHRM